MCTSLIDYTQYPHELFSELYHCRWGIEDAYKLLKDRLDLEDFFRKTAKAVRQDFHAEILMMTLCAALSFPIEEKVGAESFFEKKLNKGKHEKKINRTSALDMLYGMAVGIFIKRDFENALRFFDQLMMKTCKIIRPGRTYPRNHKNEESVLYE